MPIDTDYRVKLRDGRTIGYAEYGHPIGHKLRKLEESQEKLGII